MNVSEVQICRLALSWLGANSIITMDDDSVEAELCKENYELVRNAVLEEADWSFALTDTSIIPLTVEPIAFEGKYFPLPADCIRVVRVLDTSLTRIAYWHKVGKNIVADKDKIILIYIRELSDTTYFSPTFIQALAARLAATLAIPITQSVSVQKKYYELYSATISTATANDGLQGGAEPLPKSSLIEARSRG